MILEEEKFNLEESGSFKKNSYKIEANAVTYQMLFKNLYSNIIKAIVREISTNAWDSHVAANRADVPFTVHIPNAFEPWFSVTDTGTGMPEQFVQEEYTTFFNSNKRSTNDAAGCFGLGAKVPFAYTDSFIVTVRYNGVETIYNPIKDQQGIPTLVTLNSKPTKERNGCEVRFAVQSMDFSKFTQEAKEVYRWFKVRPIVVGVPTFTYPTEEFLRETPEYAVRKKTNYGESHVVMGNVAYPINTYNMSLDYGMRDFAESGVRLYMKIGDIQLTPSREAINYDAKTIKNIKTALEHAYIDTKAHLYDYIKDAKSIWEARCKLYDINCNSIFKFNNLTDKVKWNNIEILPYVQVTSSIISVKMYSCSYGSKYRENDPSSIDCENTIPKYHNDMGIKGLRGLKKYAIEKNIKKYLVFTDIPTVDSSGWIKETGLDEVIQKVSNIPDEYFKIIRQKGLGKGKTERSLLYKFTLAKNYKKNGDDYWVPEEVDMKEGGVYIPISRYYWVKNPAPNEVTEHPREKLDKLYENILLFEPNFNLYGIIPSNMDKLIKYPKWITLEDYLDKLIQQNLGLKKLAKHTWSYDSRHAGILANTENIQFDKKSYFGNFVSVLKNAKDKLSDKKIIAFRNILLYRKVIDTSAMTILNAAQTKVFDKYPLLHYLNLNQYSVIPGTALKDYIDTIESRLPLFAKVSNNGNKRKTKIIQTTNP